QEAAGAARWARCGQERRTGWGCPTVGREPSIARGGGLPTLWTGRLASRPLTTITRKDDESMTRTSWRKYPVDSTELDPNMRRIVAALNRFDGIQTIDSCGGHEYPTPGQWPAGRWCISLKVAHTEEGWRGLEFLARAINV